MIWTLASKNSILTRRLFNLSFFVPHFRAPNDLLIALKDRNYDDFRFFAITRTEKGEVERIGALEGLNSYHKGTHTFNRGLLPKAFNAKVIEVECKYRGQLVKDTYNLRTSYTVMDTANHKGFSFSFKIEVKHGP